MRYAARIRYYRDGRIKMDSAYKIKVGRNSYQASVNFDSETKIFNSLSDVENFRARVNLGLCRNKNIARSQRKIKL